MFDFLGMEKWFGTVGGFEVCDGKIVSFFIN